nr:MAG TPA: hypothetical protein [Caudoviricetes sp.]
MKVETKYNVNQTVYFMHENRIKSSEVAIIDINSITNENTTEIKYRVFNLSNFFLLEKELFSSKKELLEYLENN